MNIIDAIQDAKLFRPLFKNLESWAAWLVCLKCIFALPLSDEEFAVCKKFTERAEPPERPFKEVFLAIGRRGGKSFMAALVSVFLAMFKDWRPQLAPGEIGYVMCIATDRKQAGVVLKYIKAILRLPIFKGMVVNDTKEELELNNGITISVQTCSYRTIRGYTVVAAVCDEIAFWRSEGANPDKEILTALRPCMENVEGSLLLAISSTYAKAGILWDMFQRFGEDSSDILTWKAGTRDMNPSFKEKIIQKALKEDYAAARSEYFAEFRMDLETFLSLEAIDAVTVEGRYELGRRDGVAYYAFCDPSGGRGDAMTLSISHQEPSSKKIVQDCLKIKKPPFDPEDCVKEFCKTLKYYGIGEVEGDRYAAEWVTRAFDKQGIMYVNSLLDKSSIYLEFLPLVMQSGIELLDNKQQMIELRQLERRTGKGKDSVSHPKGLSDDCSNALAGSIVMAAREEGFEMGDLIVIDEEGPVKSWERDLIAKHNKLEEPKEDPAISRLSTKEFVKKYLALSKKHAYLDDIAGEMGMDPQLLKRWVQSKGDFIHGIMMEVKEDERESEFETL